MKHGRSWDREQDRASKGRARVPMLESARSPRGLQGGGLESEMMSAASIFGTVTARFTSNTADSGEPRSLWPLPVTPTALAQGFLPYLLFSHNLLAHLFPSSATPCHTCSYSTTLCHTHLSKSLSHSVLNPHHHPYCSK